jgi:hypothetical protein
MHYIIAYMVLNSKAYDPKSEIALNHSEIFLISSLKNSQKSVGIPKAGYFFILSSLNGLLKWFLGIAIHIRIKQPTERVFTAYVLANSHILKRISLKRW